MPATSLMVPLGTPAPDFKLPSVGGQHVALADLDPGRQQPQPPLALGVGGVQVRVHEGGRDQRAGQIIF